MLRLFFAFRFFQPQTSLQVRELDAIALRSTYFPEIFLQRSHARMRDECSTPKIGILTFPPGIFTSSQFRCCGLIFCDACSSNRLLLPEQFDTLSPERVCNACAPKLEPEQARLAASRTNSMLPNELKQGDYTGSNRRYLNQPIKFDLSAEIRKACWSIRNHIDGLQTELQDSNVNESFLSNAVGLCFITTLQGGLIFTGTIGTGLIVKKHEDGSWSAPCAVGTIGVGVGASIGLQSTDCIITISEEPSFQAFLTSGQFCVGAEVGLSVGPFGRTAKADVRSNERATAITASYSHSKGVYGGLGLEGSILTVRHDVNRDFYGREVTAEEILEHTSPPRAAAPLYQALAHLYASFGLAMPSTISVSEPQRRFRTGVGGDKIWRSPAPGDEFGGLGEFKIPRNHNASTSFLRADTAILTSPSSQGQKHRTTPTPEETPAPSKNQKPRPSGEEKEARKTHPHSNFLVV